MAMTLTTALYAIIHSLFLALLMASVAVGIYLYWNYLRHMR